MFDETIDEIIYIIRQKLNIAGFLDKKQIDDNIKVKSEVFKHLALGLEKKKRIAYFLYLSIKGLRTNYENRVTFDDIRSSGRIITKTLERKYDKLLKSVYGGDIVEALGSMSNRDNMSFTDILESVKSGKKTPKSTSTKKNKKEVKEGVDEDVKEVANDLNKAMKQTDSVNVSKFFDEDAVEYNEKESDEEEDEEKEENYSDAVSSLAPSVISIDPVQKFKEALAISNNNMMKIS